MTGNTVVDVVAAAVPAMSVAEAIVDAGETIGWAIVVSAFVRGILNK